VPPTNDRWCAELADTLTEVGHRLARLAESVAADWPDQRGREWVDRATQVHGELVQRAGAAAELGGRIAHAAGPPTAWGAAEPPAAEPPAAGGAWGGAVGTGRTGMRLGGTGGDRVDAGRGVRIAELAAGSSGGAVSGG
jgi:hypothetical protein